MLFQILAGLACLLAATLQFAVYRSPDIRDQPFARMGRRIMIATLLVMVIMTFHAIFWDGRDLPLPVYLLFGLVGMSQSLFGMRDLYPHLEREHPEWTSRLTSSR